MLKGVTRSFVDNCNKTVVQLSEYIKIDEKKVPIKAKLNDDCYSNGNFIGTFIFKEISFETSNDIDFKKKEFEYYKVVNGEDIKIGTFITTEITDNDTTETVKVVAMDYGLRTQIEYKSSLDYSSGLVTLFDVWNECCELCGLQSGITNFANSDWIVTDDQFTGTGATVRDVYIGIALSSCNFVKVMNDDKIYLILTNETDELIENYTDLDDKRDTHPITCVRMGMSQIEGENVDLKDDELVEQYGENWLIINDNPFAYTQAKRAELLPKILEQIKGFGYSSFTAKTAFKPYLTCGDVLTFKNKSSEVVKSILLRYEHNFDEIKLEAPSIISATVNYVYPINAIDIAKRAEAIVDKETVRIDLLTEKTTIIQDNLNNNYYTKTQANELIQTSETGITNTFSEAGGNNIFKNTGLWYEEENKTNNSYEFWDGVVLRKTNENAANYVSLLLQKGMLLQSQEVPNGNYTVSFKYKKLIELANVKVVINGMEYQLDSLSDKEFQTGTRDPDGAYIIQPLMVSTRHIEVAFITDINNSCEIWDLMVNAGTVKLAYSQNQNETTTDTVNISKGITIEASATNVKFKANSDGIRVVNKNTGETRTDLTDEGITTDEIIVKNKATMCNALVQDVGDQTWLTRL